MSVVHDKTKRSDGDGEPQKWFLKLPDGNIYGPVGVDVLVEWASQLRIAPGNQVSLDKKTWQSAESIKELKMEWITELPDGSTYGPFNVLAVPHLYKNGTLPASSSLTNKDTGKVVHVHELLKESGVEIEETAAPVAPEDTLKEKKASKWGKLYKEEKAMRRKLEAKHEKDVGSLVADLHAAKDEINKIKKESTKRITEQSKSDKDKIKGAEEKGSELQAEFEKLKDQHKQDLALLKDSQAKISELDGLSASLEEAQALNDELEKTQARLKESEEKLKLFSELQSKFDQVEKDKLSIQKELKDAKELRASEQKVLAGAEAGIKKVESEISALNKSASSEKTKLVDELRGKESELRRLTDELEKAEDRCKEIAVEDAALKRQLAAIEAEKEEKASDMTFKLENMTKELETQKTLYAKIEQSGADKGGESQKEIEEAYKARDAAESLVRKLKGEVEQARRVAEKDKADFEEQAASLKAGLENARSDAERSETEKSAVTERLLSTRHDLSAQIEEVSLKLKNIETKGASATEDLANAVAARTEAKKKITILEELLEDNKKKFSELEETSAGREAEHLKELSQLQDNLAEVNEKVMATEKLLTESDEVRKSEQQKVKADVEKDVADLEKIVQSQAKEYSELEDGSRDQLDELREKIARKEEEAGEYESRIVLLEADLADRAEILKAAEKTARESGEKLTAALEDASSRLETVNLSHGRDEARMEDELAIQVKRYGYLEEEGRKREKQLLSDVSSKGDRAKEYKERLVILEKDLAESLVNLSDLEKKADKDVSEAKEYGVKDLDDAVSRCRVAEDALEKESQENNSKVQTLEDTVSTLRNKAEVQAEDLRKYRDEAVSNESVVAEGLERARTENADLRKELDVMKASCEEEQKRAETVKIRAEKLETQLQAEKNAEGVLTTKMSKLEKQLDSEKEVLAQTKAKSEKDEGSMVEQETKYREMLAKDRGQIGELMKEANSLRSELKAVKDERNGLLESQEKQRSESSGLSVDRGQLIIEKEQLLIEKAELGDGMKKMKKDLIDATKGNEHVNSALTKKLAELEKVHDALSEKERTQREFMKKSKEEGKEHKARVKHLQDISRTSAEVVERLNAQIIDYRAKYDKYEEKTKKLLVEVDEKKSEMSDLRHSYEPLLKQSQQSEKDLLKKVAKLESEKARLLRPIEPMSDRIGGVVESVRLGISGTEGFFKQYPYLTRNAFVAVLLLLFAIIIFKADWAETDVVELTPGERVVEVAHRKAPMVLTREQTEIEKKVEAVENALMAVSLEVTKMPEEPEMVQLTAVVEEPEVIVVAAVPEVQEVVEEIDEVVVEPVEEPVAVKPAPKPVEVVRPAVVGEDLDLDLEPVAPPVAVTVAVAPPAPTEIKWPLINVQGTRVDYTGKMCRIVFDDGVFTHMTVIPEEMLKVLSAVAAQVKTATKDFKMIVEGHCDSVPLSGKSSVKSNYVLGLARSRAVVKLFEQKFGVPVEFMIPTSSGEKDPPFLNDNPAERKKNRTVVLEIIPNR